MKGIYDISFGVRIPKNASLMLVDNMLYLILSKRPYLRSMWSNLDTRNTCYNEIGL
jgi:hypothetical protein